MTPLEQLLTEDLPCRLSPVYQPVTKREAARNRKLLEAELLEHDRLRKLAVAVAAEPEPCALCGHPTGAHDFDAPGTKYDDAPCPQCPGGVCRIPRAAAS